MNPSSLNDLSILTDPVRKRLLDEERIVILDREITDSVGTEIIASLLYLEDLDPDRPIRLFINSSGGSVSTGFAILDTMDQIKPAVHTFCFGWAHSFAAIIVAHGARGYRCAAPHARFAITKPFVPDLSESDADLEVYMEELSRVQSMLAETLAKDTGNSVENILIDMQEGRHLDAEQAREYNLVDSIRSVHPLDYLRSCVRRRIAREGIRLRNIDLRLPLSLTPRFNAGETSTQRLPPPYPTYYLLPPTFHLPLH